MTKNSKIGLPEKPSPTLLLAQVALDRIKLGYQDQPSWNELRRHVEDLAYALNESEASEDILLAERDRLREALTKIQDGSDCDAELQECRNDSHSG